MTKITRTTTLVLTPTGRRKVESMGATGLELSILSHLYDSGGMTFPELQGQIAGASQGSLIAIIKVLVRKGYIRAMGGGGEGFNNGIGSFNSRVRGLSGL